jgi:hypothetical protein
MIKLEKGVISASMVERMSRRWEIKMLRTLIAVLIPSLVMSPQAMSQSFEQFERTSQFERAMAVVDQIRGRKKLQCLISIGNRPLCECLSTRLPFTLHISNYVSIANQDKGTADYGQLAAADRQTVDQCVADNH